MALKKSETPVYVELDEVLSAIGIPSNYMSCHYNSRECSIAEEVFHAVRERILSTAKHTREDLIGESEWLPTGHGLSSVQCKECGKVHDTELPHCPFCGRLMVEKEN